MNDRLRELIAKLRKSADDYDDMAEASNLENKEFYRGGSAARNEDADLVESLLASSETPTTMETEDWMTALEIAREKQSVPALLTNEQASQVVLCERHGYGPTLKPCPKCALPPRDEQPDPLLPLILITDKRVARIRLEEAREWNTRDFTLPASEQWATERIAELERAALASQQQKVGRG